MALGDVGVDIRVRGSRVNRGENAKVINVSSTMIQEMNEESV